MIELIDPTTATCGDYTNYVFGKGFVYCGKRAVGVEVVTDGIGNSYQRPLCHDHADEFIGDSLVVLRFSDPALRLVAPAALRARVPFTHFAS